MTFWDQGDSKGPIWIHQNQKIKIDNIHCERGFNLHFGRSWPIVRHASVQTPFYNVFPHMVSALEYFPPLNSFLRGNSLYQSKNLNIAATI